MKKRFLFIFICLLCSCFIITGCGKEDDDVIDFCNIINIKLYGKVYKVQLEDNKTSRALYKKLSISGKFNELNGNEKYLYLDYSLPTNSKKVDKINKGDLYLYGDNCLVVFYKDFNTSYSYTKIGRILNVSELEFDDRDIDIELYYAK